MQKKQLPELPQRADLKGKYVLLRASFNVPLQNGVVRNRFRIMRAIPTIKYLMESGARIVIISHIGRDKEDSLRPVYEVLKELIPVTFSSDLLGEHVIQKRNELKDGEVLMLENLRSDIRENQNDSNFAQELAALADLYVNNAFAASHRGHTSLVGVPQYLPSYFGDNFIHEYEELMGAMEPKSPSLFILGGAKAETKVPLIEKYTEEYNHVFVGGAIANDFFRAKGYEIGQSLVSDVDLLKSDLLKKENILLPIDVTVRFDSGIRTTTPDRVEKHENILDAGPETIAMLSHYISEAETILWNGPLGDYEHGFDTETKALAKIVAEASGYSIVGGGDTVASIEALNLQEEFNFLSIAGGAMLTLLEHGTLPAIEAVLASRKKAE